MIKVKLINNVFDVNGKTVFVPGSLITAQYIDDAGDARMNAEDSARAGRVWLFSNEFEVVEDAEETDTEIGTGNMRYEVTLTANSLSELSDLLENIVAATEHPVVKINTVVEGE